MSNEHFNDVKMEYVKSVIKEKWMLLQSDLLKGRYGYDDIDEAKESAFLSEFDDLFVSCDGQRYLKKSLCDVFKFTYFIRGAKITSKEVESINAERFIPKSEYISKDNRFSPKGVEWLYLTLGYPRDETGKQIALECAKKECSVEAGEIFASCEFDLIQKSVQVVDLTVGDNWTAERQQMVFRELIKRNNASNEYDSYEEECAIQKGVVSVYAKLISKGLFVPVEEKNKSVEYLPFQFWACYFKRLGYGGIIYDSAVCKEGKNLVLFDKMFACPIADTINVVQS